MRILSFDTSSSVLHLSLLEPDLNVRARHAARGNESAHPAETDNQLPDLNVGARHAARGDESACPAETDNQLPDLNVGARHAARGDGFNVVYEKTLAPTGPERQEVGSLLMVEIDAAFKATGWRRNELDLIVVGTGPGSFTGIRVAVITARTLADALALPLIGVPLLETYAYAASGAAAAGTANADAQRLPIAIVLSTTSKQYFFGKYSPSPADALVPLQPPTFGTAEVVTAELREIAECYADDTARSDLPQLPLKPLPLIKNIGSTQAQLAYNRLSLKELLPRFDDGNKHELAETFPWHAVLPLYLRSPSVTLKKNYAATNTPTERG
jgi:tRNA threonylcarbamoyl adenosine modification protein YeaZ